LLDFATPFHARVSKLKSPTSSAFNSEEWVSARDEELNATDSDNSLLTAALWLGAQSAAYRAIPPDPQFDALDSSTAVTLAIATINREFLATNSLSAEMMKEAHRQDAVAFGHIVARPLRAGMTMQSLTADEAIEGTVDAAESWLFDAYARVGQSTVPPDLAPLAFGAIGRYGIQHGLNDIWNQCLWEGWRLTQENNKILWFPSDRPLATKLQAALIRQAENFMNYPFIDMTAWAALSPEGRQKRTLARTVIEASVRGRRKLRVGRPSCRSRRPPIFLIERGGLEGSYLNFLLDTPFPKERRFTARSVLEAWAIILDLSRALAKELRGVDTLSLGEARRFALLVSRSELLDVLTRALSIDESTGEALIQFLTFAPKMAAGAKGHRGLWAAPLVPIPGEDRIALALPALAVSNTLRKAEAWLERGGLDDSLSKNARGDLFETEYRTKVAAAIERNPLLQNSNCAKAEIKKSPNFDEQIDLLVRLDSLLIVGEVKCWLYPADSIERFQHFKKIEAAAEQAVRKADLLRERPDVAAKALGLTEAEVRALRVVPLVVANQGFGFSLNARGCLITDAAYLETYLGSGSISSGMVIDHRTGRSMTTGLTLYQNEKEAADKFESLFATPPVLQRFIDRISWTTVPFPLPGGGTLDFAVPRLEDITGEERLRAKLVGELLMG
jgi:hypothetical protein